MARLFHLFGPALIPSWRFFDIIAPSPRIEVNWRAPQDETSETWINLHQRPAHISFKSMFKRLFWNPDCNDALFMVSCAERLMDTGTDHSAQEILARILAHCPENPNMSHVQFRVVFISRHGAELIREITYVSPVHDVESLQA